MNYLRRIYNTMTRDRWEIGFVEGGLEAVMEGSVDLEINWVRHHYKDRWFADPFVLEVTESEIVVLVEEYMYSTGKGRIAELIIDRNSYVLKELNIILELDTHLSFPAIWREDSRVFVYPESWLSGKLSLYEYEGRGREMKLVKVLCGEPMADAIMTEGFGKKTLLSTKENDKLRLYDYHFESECFVFSKEKDFGSATARNAGDFFEYKGKTYRPAQVCINRYGEAIEIQEVTKDLGGDLQFIPIRRFYSPHIKLRTGMHTLNSCKGLTVIDVHGWVNPLVVNTIIKIKGLLLGKEWKRKN